MTNKFFLTNNKKYDIIYIEEIQKGIRIMDIMNMSIEELARLLDTTINRLAKLNTNEINKIVEDFIEFKKTEKQFKRDRLVYYLDSDRP